MCNGSNMLNGRTISINEKKNYTYTMKCNKDQM